MSLEALRKRIRKCRRCGENRFWGFPTEYGVRGFEGDKDYIFACPQPHEGKFFAHAHDRKFYANMVKYGFAEVHLTDVVKCRGKKYKELTKREVNNCVEWFDEEVRIVKPKAIIAFGKKAFDALMSMRRFQPVLRISHYSAQISDAEHEKEFKALKSYLNSHSYRHGMKIRDLITQTQRREDKSKQKYNQFIELLNELRGKEKISAESRRNLSDQWRNEPHTRTILLERLKRLQTKQ